MVAAGVPLVTVKSPSTSIQNTPSDQRKEINQISVTTSPSPSSRTPPAAIPIEESRQDSFDLEQNMTDKQLSGAIMSSSSFNESSKNNNHKSRDNIETVNSNSGFDSTSSSNPKVRFTTQDDVFLHRSVPNITTLQLNASDAPLDRSPAPSSSTLPMPSPSILNTKSKHKTTSSTRPSVFERLSQAETIASLHQKFLPVKEGNNGANGASVKIERKMKRSTSAPPSLRTKNNRRDLFQGTKNDEKKKKSSRTKKTNKLSDKIVQLASSSFDLFERLAEDHTALSKSRRRSRRERQLKDSDDKKKNNTTKRSNSLGRRHNFDRWNSSPPRAGGGARRIRLYNPNRNKRVKETLDEAFDVESAGPPLEIEFSSKMRVMCSNKFQPEDGMVELDLFELGLNTYLSEYEAGELSAKAFGSEIMKALLWRDLPTGIKWNVRCPLERELAMPIGEIGYSFMLEASGKSIENEEDSDEPNDDDDEDLYTASASGNVTFLPDSEIQVENYSCVHDVTPM